jgi:hypothetical protein
MPRRPAGARPATTFVRRRDTHRLVPSRHSAASVLTRIADDDAHLAHIFDLDQATNDRLLAESGRGAGLGPRELVFDIPFAAVINAAFCHPNPLGARFSGPDRGAWYAAFELKTAQAEVGYHKSVELAEVDWWHESTTYDDYTADLSGAFHDLRGDARFRDCLASSSYVASQRLAERLLELGSLGLVYPSVRRAGGTCLVSFRPSLVTNVRRRGTWRFTWRGGEKPAITRVSSI